jgi:hypothetical protein
MDMNNIGLKIFSDTDLVKPNIVLNHMFNVKNYSHGN